MLSFSSFDQSVLNAFNQQLPGYTWFFYLVTQLGSPLALSILASLVFILGKKKRKTFAAILIIGLLFSMFVVEDVKDIVMRPRPDIVRAAPYLTMSSYSFPSGHAFTIFMFVSILGAYFGWKYYIIGYLIAIAVSLSRLYVGVHYPSDILAGAILGMAMGEMLVFAAYRLGLSDNYGLLSHRLKPRGTPEQAKMWGHGPEHVLSLTVFIGALLSIGLFYLKLAMIDVFIIAAASLFIILYVLWSEKTHDRAIFMAFVILAIGLISTIALYHAQEYGLSLVAVAITYIATIALPRHKSASAMYM